MKLTKVFYAVVVSVSLFGAAQAATLWLHWPLWTSLIAVGCVEFGGIVVSNHADVRMRMGEVAFFPRLLSGLIAIAAVCVNLFGHWDASIGSALFFALLSGTGYAVWLMDTGAHRRDALRRSGRLQDTPPAYGVLWLTSPRLARTAHTLSVESGLSKTESLKEARELLATVKRTNIIRDVIRKRLVKNVGKNRAAMILQSYDLDDVAHRMMASVDHDAFVQILVSENHPMVFMGGHAVGKPKELPAGKPDDEILTDIDIDQAFIKTTSTAGRIRIVARILNTHDVGAIREYLDKHGVTTTPSRITSALKVVTSAEA